MQKYKIINNKHSIDRHFLFLTLVLTILGIIAIANVSSPIAIRDFGDKYYFAKQQTIAAFIGLLLMIVTANINYRFWEKISVYLFSILIILLVLVLIPGIGVSALGAQRRIFLGSASFQPSEPLKLFLSLYIAKVTIRNKKIISYLFPTILSSFLIMLQPDLGTTLVILAIGFAQMFVAGIDLLKFILFVIGGGGLVGILILISEYRRERLLTFLEQTRDPLGKSYHIRQILFALGSGGLLGAGLGNSRQKYLFLPETATDSIFAVLGEEFGFLGSIVIIIIYLYFLYRCLKIALNAPDDFSRVYAIGILTWIGFQTFLNIAGMVALVPLTGIPLPFISYGGSSLISILIGCGILINISKYGKQKT